MLMINLLHEGLRPEADPQLSGGKVRSVGPRRSAGSAAQHALSRTARGKFVRSTLNIPLPSPFS